MIRVSSRLRTRRRASRSQRSRAQALVEFAIILPVFLLLLLIAIDFGRLFFSYIEISNAAREGAAFASSSPTNQAGIEQHANQETNVQGQGLNASVISVSCANQAGASIACTSASGGAGIGNSVTVVVDKPFSFLTPIISGFFGGNLPMTASASAIVLGFAPSPTSTDPAACAGPSLATFTVVVSGNQVDVNPSASQPDNGICAISGYNWEWGDGDEEAGSAVASSHTYASNGTYVIKLTVTNQGGDLIATQSVTIGPAPSASPSASPSSSPSASPSVAPCTRPVANFTATRSGPGNKTYNYNDTSTVTDPLNCPITAWFWEFDDGANVTNAISPIHTYATGGSHTATLTVTNAGGSSSVTRTQ